MKRPLAFTLLALAAAALIGAILWSFLAHRTELTAELQGEEAIKNPTRVVRGTKGEAIVKLDRETQTHMDIQIESVRALSKRREIVAYGHLEEDPSRSFIVRAPVAGLVRSSANQPWPEIGQSLADHSVIGVLEPRLAPADRITLGDRLTAARADEQSAAAALAAARSALDRAHVLNADDKNVSDRAVQEAEARVDAEQARRSGAQQSVKLLESSLSPPRDAAAPLELERGGQVVDVIVHPDESVESGQPILRVARFDRLLARVDVPAGETVSTLIASANIAPLGRQDHPIRGDRVALAASIDPKTQGIAFLFRVSDPSFTLRPGLSVTAYLELPEPPRRGAIVTRSAIVRQSGRAWAYVQNAEDSFTRREIVLEEPAGDGWFTKSLSASDRVVTRGAQLLLSEEFKSQIQVGEESQQ